MRTPLNCLSLALALLFGTASVAWADDITVCSKTVRSNCSEEDDCKSSLIKDDKEWEECTYLVQEHIRVRRGATLTLDPGVTLEFTAPGISLQVGGTLIARGTEGTEETEGKPITFTSGQATPATGDWGGILFSKTAIGASFKKTGETVKYDRGSILEHCVVEFAGWGTSEAAIWAKSPRAPFISQSTIQKNKTSGIRFERNQYARILGNTISENGGSGIYINRGKATLSGNTIKENGSGNNGDGIELYRGTATLSDNQILENKRRGITVGGTAKLSGNKIWGNTNIGFYLTMGKANLENNCVGKVTPKVTPDDNTVCAVDLEAPPPPSEEMRAAGSLSTAAKPRSRATPSRETARKAAPDREKPAAATGSRSWVWPCLSLTPSRTILAAGSILRAGPCFRTIKLSREITSAGLLFRRKLTPVGSRSKAKPPSGEIIS